MEDTRKGFLTPEQEKELDNLIVLKGIAEAMDGVAITLLDNQGLERLKATIIEKFGDDVLPYVYTVVDSIFAVLAPQQEG